jgi:hypothetical protein
MEHDHKRQRTHLERLGRLDSTSLLSPKRWHFDTPAQKDASRSKLRLEQNNLHGFARDMEEATRPSIGDFTSKFNE